MNKAEKKICFIVPTLRMGGMERVVSLVAGYSSGKGYRVYILCLLNDSVQYEIQSGVTLVKPEFKYRSGLVNKIRVFIYLIRMLKVIHPDSILSVSEVFNPLAIICAKILGFPIYVSDRSNPQKKFGAVTQFLRQLTYPLANGIIAQTGFSKNIALSRGYNTNIKIIPNPLVDFGYRNRRIKRNVILSMGRLIPSKNFKALIDIFSKSDCEEKWELWILGDGPQRRYLESYIVELGLESRVKLIGAVNDVEKYFSMASIFAFTSLSEGYPNSLSEALAYPLPCVAYDCQAGPSDLITHNINGYLISMNNEDEFIFSLKKLMKDESLRAHLTANYIAHCERHNVDTISKGYIDFILSHY